MANTLMRAGTTHARLVRTSRRPLELIGRSPAIALVQDLVRRAASARGGVLFVAERGVELEPIARELHGCGPLPSAPYTVLDCADGDAVRIERRLFGDVPDTAAPLDLEAVGSDSQIATTLGGTLFLQEVGELPSGAQARLARVVRDGEVWVDGQRVTTAIWLVAGAAPTIDADVRAHRFRGDLYRRLAASRIDWPALRDRQADIPEIVAGLLEELSLAHGVSLSLTAAALALLAAVAWPGNLAELSAVLESVVAEAHHAPIQIEDLLPVLHLDSSRSSSVPVGNLREARLRFERDYIAAALRHHNWRMADAAQALGIQRPNLYRKARQLGIPLTGNAE